MTEAKEEELEEEAEWIYNGAFLKQTISLQPTDEETTKNLQAKKKIKNALNYIRNDSFEVRPFDSRMMNQWVIFRFHLLPSIEKNILNPI